MRIDAQKLREKGWSEAEIKHTQGVLAKVKRRKHPHREALLQALFWGLLALSAGSMVAVSYLIIPLFIISSSTIIYPVLIIIGLSLGSLVNHTMKDLDHLKTHHHVIVGLVVPITGIISFLSVLGRFGNVPALGGVTHSALLSAITFIISFLAPYAYHHLQKR